MLAYLDARGTLTLPREICEQIGLKMGGEVEVKLDPDGRVTLAKISAEDWAARHAKLDPDRFKKMVGTLKSDMTTDEIMLELRGERDDLLG